MNPKSILFITEYYPPIIHGGGEINTQLTAEALAEKGFTITILTSWFPGLRHKEIINGVTILRSLKTGRRVDRITDNIKRMLFFEKSIIAAVRKITKEKKMNVIHCIGTSLSAARHLKLTSIPVVATVESYIALCPKGDFLCGRSVNLSRWSFPRFVWCLLNSEEIGKVQLKPLLKYNPLFWIVTYHRFTHLEKNLRHVKLIAISKFVHNLIKTNYARPSAVIPNFIEPQVFAKRKRRNTQQLVVYLGSFTEHKGPQIFLQAIKDLNCKVELYGDGPLKPQLKSIIKEGHISAELKPPAPYNQIPDIYARADIVVFPSLWPEPFGRIAIEALASGTPVIASGIGGIEETLPPGTGILVPPGNVEKLNDAIKLLLANPKWRKSRAVAGKQFIQTTYSKDVVIKKLIQFYNRL